MPYIARHDSGLIDRRYWSINQVAEMFDIYTSELRYWEARFEILRPKRNKRGDRRYTMHDLKTVRRIYNLLNTDRLTIKGAIKRIEEIEANAY